MAGVGLLGEERKVHAKRVKAIVLECLRHLLSSITGLLLPAIAGLAALFVASQLFDVNEDVSPGLWGVLASLAAAGTIAGRYIYPARAENLYGLSLRLLAPGILSSIALWGMVFSIDTSIWPFALSAPVIPMPFVILGMVIRGRVIGKSEGDRRGTPRFAAEYFLEKKIRAGEIAMVAFFVASAFAAVVMLWFDDYPLSRRLPEGEYRPFPTGRDLSSWDAFRLEWHVRIRGDDENARMLLLDYYDTLTFFRPMSDDRRFDNYAWFVRNRPESRAIRYTDLSQRSCEKAVLLWKARKALKSKDSQVLINAGVQAADCDAKSAEAYFKRAEKLDPKDEDPAERLGFLYGNHGEELGYSCKRSKELALEAYERAVAKSPEEYLESPLEEAAKMAMDLCEVDKAERYATRLIEWSDGKDPDWAANALHHGHNVLGRVALHRKDVERAKRELLLAGDVEGAFNLNSFGPNMQLAKELLEVGEREAVLQYFDRVSRFWKSGCHGSLEGWAKTIRQGGIPDFGSHLLY